MVKMHPIVRGIIKISLAMPMYYILSGIDWSFMKNVTIGNTTADLSIVGTVITAFSPLFLIVSGLRDLGVNL
jgi:hypothetical protein